MKAGWIFKKGAVRKNWKRRFLIIKPDYNADYFEKEISQDEFLDYWIQHESFEAPTPTDGGKQREELRKKFKPKGTMNLVGYSVRPDKNSDDEFEGKEFGLELYHSNKRCWYIVCNSNEDRESWEEALRLSCWFAKPYENPDPVAAAAFETAFVKTRQALGRWGWWWSQGSEEERLSELITVELNSTILNQIYSELPGPPKVQAAIRANTQKLVKGAVSTPVSSAWAACLSGVNQSRPTLEATCKEKLGPLMEAEKQLRERIEEAVMSTVNPILDLTVNEFMPAVLSLMEEIPKAIKAAFDIYDSLVAEVNMAMSKGGKAAAGPLMQRLSRDLRWWRWSKMRPVTEILESLRKKLDAMDNFIRYISSWAITEHIRYGIAILIDDALYNFELEMNEATKDMQPADVAAEQSGITVALSVRKKLFHDAIIRLVEYHDYVMKQLLLPPYEEQCMKPCLELVKPFTPPEELQSLISPPNTLEELLRSIAERVIRSGVEAGTRGPVLELRSTYSELQQDP
eukprot:TRINITY_DN5728_c0_g1_i1.p1 TRINITY_DN5728_c0_g1~~TRINITY_DN5728_c0_g1_i1.p1  ORF type:complete len:515 (-),score=121.04 TRINITY_DN5728_c0_g1_i1:57-1601(-)